MANFIYLLLGFVVIIFFSDLLVDAASSLAIKFKVPKMLIALTIVSFGTCAPEIAISIQSVSTSNGSIAFSNIIGSCIVNVFLIIGIASIIKPIKIKHNTIKKELPILVIITAIFSVLMLDSLFNPKTDDVFSKADGIILILVFSLFVFYLVHLFLNKRSNTEVDSPKYNIFISIILLIVSIIMIIFSSDLIVNSATKIASMFGISEKIITMTTIVIGTSLPELFMTVTSAKKGEFDIAIGNIIGTNIFNICIVLGLPVAIYGDLHLTGFGLIDILIVFLSSYLLYLFARSEKEITRRESIIMLGIFIMYYIYVFLG